MTPQEIIKARMIELWGEVNIAKLARESGVPRESISKVLNYKRGLGDDVAGKLATVLNLDASELLPPPTERVTLGVLLHRLDEERAQAEKGRRALARSLAAIHADLRSIEARLPAEAPPAQEGRSL